jgi:hypothetical protein
VGAARVLEAEGSGEADRLREGGLVGATMSPVARGTSDICDTTPAMT